MSGYDYVLFFLLLDGLYTYKKRANTVRKKIVNDQIPFFPP